MTLATASHSPTRSVDALQLIWNSWRSGNLFDSRLDYSPLLLYAFRLLFVCSSFAFFACFSMAVLRLPLLLLLLLPSGLVFYVVKVLRYARLTGKGKADFLAASALRHAHRLSAQCMRPTATATQLSSATFAKKKYVHIHTYTLARTTATHAKMYQELGKTNATAFYFNQLSCQQFFVLATICR